MCRDFLELSCLIPRLLGLLNEPGVVDGHGGTVGQGLKEIDLIVCELVGREIPDVQRAVRILSNQNRHREYRTCSHTHDHIAFVGIGISERRV